MTTAFVTGATGFIGRHLVDALLESGYHVVGLTRRPQANDARERLRWVVGDLSSLAALAEGAAGADVVFHLAAAVSDSTADPDTAERIGDQGTQNVVDAAVRAGVRRFVHMSSGVVYAVQPHSRSTTEESPLISDIASSHPYARQKLLAEAVVWRADTLGDLDVVCIRPPLVLGAGDDHLVSILQSLFTSTAGTILNDEGARMHWVDVRDLVRAVIAAAESPQAAHKAYNVAVSNVTKRELRAAFAAADLRPEFSSRVKRIGVPAAARLFSLANRPFQSKGEGSPVRRAAERLLAFKFGPPVRDGLFDCSKAREELGWEPTVPVSETARAVVSWSNRGFEERQLAVSDSAVRTG